MIENDRGGIEGELTLTLTAVGRSSHTVFKALQLKKYKKLAKMILSMENHC
jgi:hypothetical protein